MTTFNLQTKHTQTNTLQDVNFGALLLDQGGYLLLDQGGKLLLENVRNAYTVTTPKHTQSFTLGTKH